MSARNPESVVPLTPANRPPSRAWITWVVPVAVLIGLAGGGWVWWKSQGDGAQAKATGSQAERGGTAPDSLAKVEVVTPTRGGIDRVCVQPGSVEPFESAELFAKVSGFLADQRVDIGSRVKAGQLLAVLSVPELDKQVERDAAKLDHERAKVAQAEARIVAAEADAKAAAVSVPLARTVLNAKASYRKFRQKQLARLTELSDQKAIEARVVDEAQDQYESAVEAETAAKEGIAAAEQRAAAAVARVAQARADLDESKAAVKETAAELERSKVFLGYTRITSPYDGVVTKRGFNRGDFIRAADSGGERVALLAVERTDKMRVVVQVPDRDVPYVDVGDPAEVETDALPGQPVKAVISRTAESEDSATRTMRTEVDVPNADGKLRRGMYGRVTLRLAVGRPDALTVPSAALAGKSEGSRATAWVVRDGVARKVELRIGADNGVQVEVIAGLKPDDRVIVRANGPLEDGAPVEATAPKGGR